MEDLNCSPAQPSEAEDLKQEDDDPPTTKGKAHKQPSKIACLACRAIKVKCRLPNNECPTGKWDVDKSKCTRCIRLKLPCEYKSAPRKGRRPKDRCAVPTFPALDSILSLTVFYRSLLVTSTTPQPQPQPELAPDDSDMLPIPPTSGIANDSSAPFFLTPPLPSTSTAPPTSQWPPHNPLLSPHLSYSPQAHGGYLPQLTSQAGMALQPPTFPPPAPPSQPAQSSPAHSHPSHSQPSPASVASASGATQNQHMEHSTLSLAEAVESKAMVFSRAKMSLFAPKTRTAPPKQPDPVDLGILSVLESQQLIGLFHTNLNQFVILLDRHYHTMEFVRNTSTVLFTAMLAVSSKFFRQDLYPSLLLSAQQLVTRCMGGDSHPHIGLIQAILILVYWKEPFDSSAWLKVGYAIRLGYQLGLHHKRKVPLPQNEYEARAVLDGERTWITLVCFDHSYILSEDLDQTYETRMVTQHDIDIDAWLAESRPYDVLDDNEQGASIELIRVARLCRNVANATSKQAASTLATHLHSMLMGTYSKYIDSSSPVYRVLNPQAAHKVRFHWRSNSVALAKACLIAAGVEDQMVLAEFMARASELVETFEDLAREGLLRFLQDLVAQSMLSFGEFLGKLFSQVNQMVQTTLVKFLTQIYTAAARAKDGNDDSVAGFVARFYRAVLTALRGPGTLPETRPSSPGAAHQMDSAAGVNPFEQLGGMESELFTDLDSLVAELSRDNSYWDSINSAQTNSSWAWLDQALLPPPHGASAQAPPSAG
ncbi:hypothetical protein JCM11251_007819 [Rhodosporidiobolus azoricus]